MRRLAVLLLLCVAACTADKAPPVSQKLVVFFQEWSAALDDNALTTIATAAQWAKDNPTRDVTVAGYADPVGSQQANIDLSRTRAQVVVDQLSNDGVARDRVKLAARGKTDFTLSGQESRRVEIAIQGM